MTAEPRRSNAVLAAYASPTLPLAGLGLPLVVYLPEYYVSELGLSLSVVGMAFLLVRLADIVLDPILGGLMDRTRSKWGRFRPWLAASVPLLMAASYALFMAKPGIGPVFLWAWLIVVYIGFSMAVLAQTAWGAVLSPDYQQRSRIYGFWSAGNVVGMILVLLLPPLVAFAFKGDHAAGVRAMGWFIIVLMPLTALLAGVVVGEPPAPAQRHEAGLKQYLGLLKSSTVQKLLVADLLMGLAPGIGGALFFFFFERIKGIPKDQAGILLLVYFVAALAGAPLWPWIAKTMGKHTSLAIAGVMYAVFQVAAVITPSGINLFGVAVLVLAGLPYSAAPLLVRSMMADIGDEERLNTGVDRTGLLYAIVNGTVKLGFALAIGVFLVLEKLGFDPKIPSAQGDTALIVLYTVVPAALGVLVSVIIVRYPLDAKRHAEIRAKLDARDAAQAHAEASPHDRLSDTSTAPSAAQ
ncbi:MFS transporter [Caulobacter flavus]|uniref:MFS transporter n=1 Tax=Caulobacter flavus TaxID=1679497 RepID=A0A2N5CM77_9CAUL|nr:MFS transporter [Caulobacter flavus]AYV48073.1 MFS transporter [Caulobacter flavus]PLR07003.1 MFS transporter [Caulobacter flavus]